MHTVLVFRELKPEASRETWGGVIWIVPHPVFLLCGIRPREFMHVMHVLRRPVVLRNEVYDILAGAEEDTAAWLNRGFDVVLDKGTFDAICLSEEKDGRGRRVCEGYRERVEGLVREGGIFLITSCNWTHEELRSWFEGDESGLVYEAAVKYPSFTFGGKTGMSVVTLCFRRRRRGE